MTDTVEKHPPIPVDRLAKYQDLWENSRSSDGIDPDGDVWWIAIEVGPNAPIRWTITAGTGKYEGLVMSGVNNAIAEHADGITLGRFEGNYVTD